MKRALVLSLICVLGFTFAGMAATLSGSWDTDVTIDITQTDFSAAMGLSSKLTVNYIVGDWTFTSITALSELGWTDQDFNAVGVLGAFTIATALDLNPDATFGDLDLTVGVSIAGVTFEVDVDLDADLAVDLTASGVAGDVTIEAVLSFGTVDLEGEEVCDLNWTGLELTIGFPFCCVDVEAEIAFDCDGFDYVTFSFGGIAIPNLPWLTIDGSVTFDLVEGKTFSVTPVIDFGAIVCFDLYWDVGLAGGSWYEWGQGFVFDEIALSGIGLSCEIDGVTFEALTYWGYAIYGAYKDDFPGILAGFDQKYYEAYKISTTDDACCGPFDFSFAVYFDNEEAGVMDTLFDVDLFVATVELEVASQFTFDMGLTVDALGGFTEWLIGFKVTW